MNDLISRATFRSNIQTVLNDTTCPIHIAAEIEQYLELEPVVDAAPVVHAQWHELKDGTEECTNCFGLCPHEENYNGDVIFNFGCEYCPWCGAKMDGERRVANETN